MVGRIKSMPTTPATIIVGSRFKQSGDKHYAKMPLTLGYHTREDLPFYYAFADAFTICDQHFCSSLTGTTPNRLHLWTGTVRARPSADSPALVRNEDCDYGAWTSWTTFPERLEDHGVSWKIYQNELTVPNGLTGEDEAWLSNFGDNPMEWMSQFHVRFAANASSIPGKPNQNFAERNRSLAKQLGTQTGDAQEKLARQIKDLSAKLEGYQKDRAEFSPAKFAKLSDREKSLHARAFCTNVGDPAYRDLVDIAYQDGDTTRKVKVPKGDVLHQFRKDVEGGVLPTVSWIVAPEHFSDHPSSAWYGSWYVSEVLGILTKNPKVWKKTVFILTYDETMATLITYHHSWLLIPKRVETGRASKGIDTSVEYVELARDFQNNPLRAGARQPDWTWLPRADGNCFAMESGWLCLFAGFRSYLRFAFSRSPDSPTKQASRSRNPISAIGGVPSVAT